MKYYLLSLLASAQAISFSHHSLVPEEHLNLQLSRAPKVSDFDSADDYINYQDKTQDKFFKPMVYNPVENLYNTRHGELPEHNQVEFDAKLTEPEDDYTLVRKEWNMH